jgi:hypothetical protein
MLRFSGSLVAVSSNGDSADNMACYTLPGTPPRASFEIRCLLIFE